MRHFKYKDVEWITDDSFTFWFNPLTKETEFCNEEGRMDKVSYDRLLDITDVIVLAISHIEEGILEEAN